MKLTEFDSNMSTMSTREIWNVLGYLKKTVEQISREASKNRYKLSDIRSKINALARRDK